MLVALIWYEHDWVDKNLRLVFQNYQIEEHVDSKE